MLISKNKSTLWHAHLKIFTSNKSFLIMEPNSRYFLHNKFQIHTEIDSPDFSNNASESIELKENPISIETTEKLLYSRSGQELKSDTSNKEFLKDFSNDLSNVHINPFTNLELPNAAKLFISNWRQFLSDYEIREIPDYDFIYFIGDKSFNTHENAQASQAIPWKHLFDDENGNLIIQIKDHLAYRYEIIDFLGKGTYGQVIRCYDHKRKEQVAIKIIKNKKNYHKQGILELKVLQKLRENDLNGIYNTVKLKNYFLFRKHICMVFELLSINLYELIIQNNYEGISLILIHRFAVQILVCLQYLTKQKIIHCDLKPENILLKTPDKPLINIIDFGSACYESEKKFMYIQSRFYRAPEIILENGYTSAIDIWSLGCILCELFLGYPLFPGESEQHQLICMMEVLGIPPSDLVKNCGKQKLFFNADLEPKLIFNKKGVKQTPGTFELKRVLQGGPETFIDFISKCLLWRPEERMKPLEALDHPWITEGLMKKNN